jgi:hypothetical protein
MAEDPQSSNAKSVDGIEKEKILLHENCLIITDVLAGLLKQLIIIKESIKTCRTDLTAYTGYTVMNLEPIKKTISTLSRTQRDLQKAIEEILKLEEKKAK